MNNPWQYTPRILHATLILFVLLCATSVQAIWPFPPKRFSGNALLQAGSMGVETDGRVVAFGDFNGDQVLDVLTLEGDQETFTVWLWSHDEFRFIRAAKWRHPQRVYNVVPGDYTQDGRLDILVMSQSSSSNQLDIQVYVALPEGGFDLNPVSASPSSQAQPIPMDLNGDLKIDLFGTTSSSPSTFKVWQNVRNTSETSGPIFQMMDPKMDGAQCTLSNPHFNAAVDLNGDCLADLFLVCGEQGSNDKYYQIWVNNKDDGFYLAQLGRFPKGFQSVTFSDVDRDGTMDMVFVTCDSVSSSTGVGSNCMLNIAYNKQLPLCPSTTSPSVKNGKRICRPPTNLCTADPDFRYNLNEGSDNPDFVRISIASIFPNPSSSSRPLSLLVMDTTHNPHLPLPLKLGDVNQDGFPDLLAVLATGSGSDAEKTPYLAYSVPCRKGVVGCDEHGGGRRGWKVLRRGGEVLRNVKDARGIAFLDMDEDGTLDVMVQRTGQQREGNVLFVQNNFYYDAFFLKAIVLNGACTSGLCTSPNGSLRYHPYGVSYSGATYKYTVLDTSGRRSAAEVAQLPQTAYQSLLTPYSYFGLGRTNNYIENLFVGSTKHSPEHFINMEGVIPNSKVVIIPSPDTSDGMWRRELYLRPGEWIVWVTLTVVGAMFVLAIIVGVLHWNEKREDELERRRASHHINFDAL
ncbi:hypothetical protein K474DRAFT_1613628 [Panus rudis PR-1116 ss-1]|nr:hypothetical protein K474DRAFT_1613628 [Panus rudis PR-1116 ss-1]